MYSYTLSDGANNDRHRNVPFSSRGQLYGGFTFILCIICVLPMRTSTASYLLSPMILSVLHPCKKLDATQDETCRTITGCLTPTNTNSLPVLPRIAPSDIRRAVASRTERTRQATDEMHPLNGHLGSGVTPEIADELRQMH